MFGTARIKIGSGKHLHSKVYPSRTLFFGTRTIFIRAVPKIRCSVNGPKVALSYNDDKKIICKDGIHTYSYGHFSL